MNNLQKLTDEVLVTMYTEGSDNAFDVLLERHKDRLFSYILYMVHDEDYANDIFQETFVKVILTLRQGRYKEAGKFYSWLTRIAHNLVIDGFRNEMNTSIISDDEAEGQILNDANLVSASIESEMLTEQLLDDIKALMDRLPEEQRRVMFMRYYQGLSFKEIAQETGVGINTALGRMHYATINLRKMANEANIFIS